ncbi:hypothetical protein TorRG33x02_343880, partial [Trema orientale]
NMSVFGDLRLKDAATLTRIKYLKEIESSPMWTRSPSEERKSLKEELNNILFIQERAAQLKSKIQWAKLGDANTRVFYKLFSARKS